MEVVQAHTVLETVTTYTLGRHDTIHTSRHSRRGVLSQLIPQRVDTVERVRYPSSLNLGQYAAFFRPRDQSLTALAP